MEAVPPGTSSTAARLVCLARGPGALRPVPVPTPTADKRMCAPSPAAWKVSRGIADGAGAGAPFFRNCLGPSAPSPGTGPSSSIVSSSSSSSSVSDSEPEIDICLVEDG